MKFSLVLLFFFVSNCISIATEVRPDTVGLLWDSAEGKLSTLEQGRYFFFSPSKKVIIYPTRWENHREAVDVITQDDLHIDVVASIIVRPIRKDVYKLHLEIGHEYYSNIIRSEFRTSIRNVLAGYPMIQIPKKSPDIEKEIRDAVAQKIKGKYVEVTDVNIDDINLSQEILKTIELKLKKQQQLETMKYEEKLQEKEFELAKKKAQSEADAEFYRAEKEGEIAKLKAKRDAETEIILAEAHATAQKLINSNLTDKYLKLKALESNFKAFESPNSKVIFIPVGKDGLPVFVNMNDKLFMDTGESSPKKK
ncbi:MAG: prohibitin family protein [Leptospiraceae bacterium]|nr:prohibitin family protein [Leptospiraceae bacterium]